MTRIKKATPAAETAPATDLHPVPPHPVFAPHAKRQASYRERERTRHERNAQIANEAMGIVNTVRTLWDMNVDLRGVVRDADELQTLREVKRLIVFLADPFANEPAVVHQSSVTVTPSKGRTSRRQSRERVGK